MLNIPFHNQLALTMLIPHKRADKLSGVVKGNLIRFLIPHKQICIILLPSWHGLTGKDCVINGIADTGMVGTVQVCKIENTGTLISNNIHVVLQQDTFMGQCTGLVHTQHIHAAKNLHSIDILDNCLFFAHGKAALDKTGCNYHRQRFRYQADRHGQGKHKRFQPFPSRKAQEHEHNGHQHRLTHAMELAPL